MKITYWICTYLEESDCAQNLRARTRREVVAMKNNDLSPEEYGKPHKVSLEYTDRFNLLDMCTMDGGNHWESWDGDDAEKVARN